MAQGPIRRVSVTLLLATGEQLAQTRTGLVQAVAAHRWEMELVVVMVVVVVEVEVVVVVVMVGAMVGPTVFAKLKVGRIPAAASLAFLGSLLLSPRGPIFRAMSWNF